MAGKGSELASFRREISRLASTANKRIARLETNEMTDSPAYKSYLESGGKFGVKGKTHNEIQAEAARLKRFLDAKTSTVRGTIGVLKDIAKNLDIEFESAKDLKARASKFFEVASKVEQYLRNVNDSASAIGYQKIWNAINTYTKENSLELKNLGGDIDEIILNVGKMLGEGAVKDVLEISWYNPSI